MIDEIKHNLWELAVKLKNAYVNGGLLDLADSEIGAMPLTNKLVFCLVAHTLCLYLDHSQHELTGVQLLGKRT
jgi:hypothetical protein